MKTIEGTKKVRGPNATRRASTRAKLLSATIDCLYRYGYYRTSTLLVQEKAGVSRGSLLHQFPTKADLMVAVSEHIAEGRGEAHRTGLAGIEEPRERFKALIDILWGEMLNPTGVARIEIMLASRSDPELAARFAPLNASLEQRHKDRLWERAQSLGVTDRDAVNALVLFYTATLRGLAIDALFPREAGQLEAAVDILRHAHMDWLDRMVAAGAKDKAN